MLFNAGKTKSMVVSRSRTDFPCFPDLQLGGVMVENVSRSAYLASFLIGNLLSRVMLGLWPLVRLRRLVL